MRENLMICQIIYFYLGGKAPDSEKKKMSFGYSVELLETWLSCFCNAKCKEQ